MKTQLLSILCLALSLGSFTAHGIEVSDMLERQWLLEEFQFKYDREPGEIEYSLINMASMPNSTFLDVKNAAIEHIEGKIGQEFEEQVAGCKSFDEIIEVVAKVSKKGH